MHEDYQQGGEGGDEWQTVMRMYTNGWKEVRAHLRVQMKREEKNES